MKQFFSFRIVQPNKNEFYISLLAPFLFSPFYLVMPHGYTDRLVAAGAFSLALVCAFNAVLDHRRMNWLERVVAVPWFVFLLYVTPALLWDISQIEVFSNR